MAGQDDPVRPRFPFQKPATIKYPYAKFTMPDHFRGQPKFDSSKCTGCRLCIRDCPSQAITITKVGDRKFEASIDLGKCVYCAQCAETCPRKVIEILHGFRACADGPRNPESDFPCPTSSWRVP